MKQNGSTAKKSKKQKPVNEINAIVKRLQGKRVIRIEVKKMGISRQNFFNIRNNIPVRLDTLIKIVEFFGGTKLDKLRIMKAWMMQRVDQSLKNDIRIQLLHDPKKFGQPKRWVE